MQQQINFDISPRLIVFLESTSKKSHIIKIYQIFRSLDMIHILKIIGCQISLAPLPQNKLKKSL